MLTSDLTGPRPVLLDTHIWIWASGNSGGPSRFAHWLGPWIELAARERRLLVSATSVWEIALKSKRGDLIIHADLMTWVRDQKRYPGVRVLAMTSRMVMESVGLPAWIRKSDGAEHRDPCDRFLVAQARLSNATLVTCDEVILDYAAAGKLIACDGRR